MTPPSRLVDILLRVLLLLLVLVLFSRASWGGTFTLVAPGGGTVAAGEIPIGNSDAATSKAATFKIPTKSAAVMLQGDKTNCAAAVEDQIGTSAQLWTWVSTCTANNSSVLTGGVSINDGYTGGAVKLRLAGVSERADPTDCGTSPCEAEWVCGCQCRGADSAYDNNWSASPATLTFTFTNKDRREVRTTGDVTCHGTCTGGSQKINVRCTNTAANTDAAMADIRWEAEATLIYPTKASDE